ncbi:MAG TPA: glycosyltransferase family 2 protein [Chloroflexia bacterium]|nr:glycosyltransferase family 2 protein [Chloroflexia bacterium]
MPLVSAVIPTYNRCQFLSQAIESVLSQTLRDLEIIVVDDGSTDGTAEMVRERYGTSIRYIHQSNQGRSKARNIGMAAAAGKYIALLDSDDTWKSGKLEKQIRLLEASPEVGLAHTFTEVTDSSGNRDPAQTRLRLRLHASALKRGYDYLNMSRECVMFTSSVVVRRERLREIGLMDEAIASLEDWDWYLRAALVTKIATVPEPLVLYRMHDANTSMREFNIGRIHTSLKHLKLVDKSGDARFRRQAKRNLYVQLAQAHYQMGNTARCGRWMRKGVALDWKVALEPRNFRYALCIYAAPLLSQARRLKRRVAERLGP